MKFLDPLADPRWDERLLGNDDATLFHTAAWARVLSDSYGYRCCYLADPGRDRFSVLLPMMDVRSLLTGNRGVSLPFTDFCEPLIAGETPASEVADSLNDEGRRRRWKYFEVRGGKGIFGEATPAMTVLSHTLDLSPSEEALFARVRETTQRNIRKAKREGVDVAIGTSAEMLEEFFRLNCLTRRDHGLPPQPLSFFRNLHRHLLEKGLGHIVLATLRGTSIGGGLYLHFGRDALYKYGASDRRHLSLRPNDLVMWEAIRHYRGRDFRRLDFGRTEVQHEGLRRFKQSWGVAEREEPYYRHDLETGEFVKAHLKGPGLSSAAFRRLPIPVSRAIGAALYRHVA